MTATLLLAVTLSALSASAASLDFHFEAPDGTVARWSVPDVEPESALPVMTVPGEVGSWTVFSNLLGSVDGEAVVQVQVVQNDGDDATGFFKYVLRGDDEFPVEGSDGFFFTMSQDRLLAAGPAVETTLELVLPDDAPIVMIGHLSELWGDMEPLSSRNSGNIVFCDSQSKRGAHIMFMGDDNVEKVDEELRAGMAYSLYLGFSRRSRAGTTAEGTCAWTTSDGQEVSLTYRALFL